MLETQCVCVCVCVYKNSIYLLNIKILRKKEGRKQADSERLASLPKITELTGSEKI